MPGAHLYLHGICIKKMRVEYLREHIRIYSSNPIPMIGLMEEADQATVIGYEVFVYRLHNSIGRDEYEYRFSHIERQSDQSPFPRERDSINIGFSEPDKNVNLDKLKMKMRSNNDLKKLLLRFYAR